METEPDEEGVNRLSDEAEEMWVCEGKKHGATRAGGARWGGVVRAKKW
jgi:hypothetical protein